MNKDNEYKVSVVVPIYNDEEHIEACLQAIYSQTVLPDEVIVVDNNCSDLSIKIVKQFDRVSLIRERRQGLAHARTAGFDAARGDLLLRIDADTILPNQYIERLKNEAYRHPDIAGFTGYGKSRYEFLPKTSIIWSWCYFTYVNVYLGYPTLWGANMVIRKSYWRKLKKYLLIDRPVHEDQDISLALISVGGRIGVYKSLEVSVEMEGVQHFSKYHKYVSMLRAIKRLDRHSIRYNMSSRLPKTILSKRLLYWVVSAWSVYAFYVITMAYSVLLYLGKKIRLVR